MIPDSASTHLSLETACGLSPTATCRFVFDLTANEGVARAADLLFRPIKVIIIIVAALLVVGLLRRAIDRTVGRIIAAQARRALELDQADRDLAGREPAPSRLGFKRAQRTALLVERGQQRAETIGAVLRSVGAVFVYSVAVLVGLGEFGINLGPLIASAGIIGVALGFGAQSLVKDFLSGIFMVLEDQYGVGDVVDLGEASGVVEAVNLRTTQVRGLDGTLWFIPNGEIRRVGNKSQQWARAVLDVEVAYSTDISRAISVIKQVADQVWREGQADATVLEEPEIWGIEAFGENSIVIRLAIKTEAGEQWSTARVVRRMLKEAFDQAGIEIPFPQRTVWMHHHRDEDRDQEPAPAPERD
jgi:small conductance mechanosensitive channel